jgi:hypothetical protein
MKMGNDEFLALLTRVLRLYRECKKANSPYSSFSYRLEEIDGSLHLKFSFPHIGESVSVQHDSTLTTEVEEMLVAAEDYLERRAVASTTAPNDND